MRRAVWVAVGLLLVSIAGAALWVVRFTPVVRDRVVASLNDRFASQIEMRSLDVSIWPRPRVAGTGLRFRHNGRTDVPPLITLESFESSAGVQGLARTPIHLRDVQLEGLHIYVPVGGMRVGNSATAPDGDVQADHVAHAERPSALLIDEIRARSARLEIASSRPGKLPRTFDIHDLVMTGFGLTEGARFSAGITNPVPKGRVETSGVFGPWHADAPELTPVSGEYAFKKADLGVINGIGGTLVSVGRYRGVLERIEVEGQTETPDFSIDAGGQPVSLSTRFTALVDGTNGDTFLRQVNARLGDTTILASGSVVRTQEIKGRHIALDVRIVQGQLEDVMRLAMKSTPAPIVGRVDLTTSFLLPTGPEKVLDRLQLNGRFKLAEARFTNVDVQRKITTLSLRGRGEEDAVPDGQSIVSNLGGRFVLRNARLSFSELTFSVPGAAVRLAGTYDIRREVIDFKGDLLTDASLSDMTSGFKSLLARLAQPFFRRPGGGTRLPIRVTGPRARPAFGLDMSRVFGR